MDGIEAPRRQPLRPTRRTVLRAGAGAVAALGGGPLSSRLLKALAVPRGAGRLTDMDEVVFFMEENRSFEHYFGTYPAVRGFQDPTALSGVFEQPFAANKLVAPVGKLLPYHLDTSAAGGGECTPDPGHSYGTQHASWNGGSMDGWGAAHAGDNDWSFMGYYNRGDLPYFYAVADAFTICDAYHASAMGSTTSNRLYALTGMLDPEGRYGGPVKSTVSWSPQNRGVLDPRWITYPEVLTDAGVSWKCYAPLDADDQDNPLVDFKQYYPGNPAVDPVRAAKLIASLFAPSYENFLAHAAAGTLPQVSWVLSHITQSEHPAAAPQDGEAALEAGLQAAVGEAEVLHNPARLRLYAQGRRVFHPLCPRRPPSVPRGGSV